MSTVNLLPEDYVERRSQQRANVLCLVLFSLVMAGVIGAAVVSEEQVARVRGERDQVNEEYHKAGELIARTQQLETKRKQVIDKAQVAADLLERVPRSFLLASLTNALPEGASLREVMLTTERPKVIRSAPKSKFQSRSANRKSAAAKPQKATRQPLRVDLLITGLAQTDVQVAQFIATIQTSPLIKSVELVYSEEKKVDKVLAREFQVTISLRTNAEVKTDQANVASVDGENVHLAGNQWEGSRR